MPITKPPYTEEEKQAAQEYILEGLSDGKSLRAICRENVDGPSIATVMRWLTEDKDWQEQYARARNVGDEAMFEDIQVIADSSDLDPKDRRVKIDARKWMLGKRQPKKYGESSTIRHADADGEKIEMDEVGRATRLAAIFAQIEKRREGAD